MNEKELLTKFFRALDDEVTNRIYTGEVEISEFSLELLQEAEKMLELRSMALAKWNGEAWD